MSEKRKISGVRTDIPLSEFKSKLDKEVPKEKKSAEKGEGFFAKAVEVLRGLGLLPTFKTSSSKGHGASGHVGGGHHSSDSFKESYRVDSPAHPSYDEVIRREIALHQYLKDTDGIPNDHQGGRTWTLIK